jgi:hypothetical protein
MFMGLYLTTYSQVSLMVGEFCALLRCAFLVHFTLCFILQTKNAVRVEDASHRSVSFGYLWLICLIGCFEEGVVDVVIV